MWLRRRRRRRQGFVVAFIRSFAAAVVAISFSFMIIIDEPRIPTAFGFLVQQQQQLQSRRTIAIQLVADCRHSWWRRDDEHCCWAPPPASSSSSVTTAPQPPRLLLMRRSSLSATTTSFSSTTTTTAAPSSTPILRLDPTLTRQIIESSLIDNGDDDDETDNDDDDESSSSSSALPSRRLLSSSSSSFQEISHGLAVWKSCLLRGRLPVQADFDSEMGVWPSSNNSNSQQDGLWEAVQQHLAARQLPRLVVRHPVLCHAVLRCLVRMVAVVAMERQQQQEEANSSNEPRRQQQDDDDTQQLAQVDFLEQQQQQQERRSLLVDQLVTSILDETFPDSVVEGVFQLDQLFGYSNNNGDEDPLLLDNASGGFGLNAGVWQHSGWWLLPALQQKVVQLPELRALLRSLGRRPVSKDSGGRTQRWAPRTADSEGADAARIDVTARSAVTGLTLSGSLAEMLPCEALLLLNSSSTAPATTTATQLRRQRRRRSFFWAKFVEGKLLSYELSGWIDEPSRVVEQQRPPQRLPSAPGGGPLVVCLDTSWSMTSAPHREFLSKAVVVAAVAAAHRQRRPCHVVAFAAGDRVMDISHSSMDATPGGVRRLLDFLGHSFAGGSGTDVTGALRYAVRHVLSNNETVMAGADLLLVTDGEIPPVDDDRLLRDLRRRRDETGMQMHGLLVGRRESAPLRDLCTQTHNFLCQYDFYYDDNDVLLGRGGGAGASRSATTTITMTAWTARQPTGGIRRKLVLRRKRHYGWWCSSSSCRSSGGTNLRPTLGARGATRKGNRRRNRFDYNDDDDDDYLLDEYLSPSFENASLDNDAPSYSKDEEKDTNRSVKNKSLDTFATQVQEAVQKVRAFALKEMEDEAWQVSELDEEKNRMGSCWLYRDQLREAVARVNDNLVEREEESRLVVLGMAAGEHVLFLGPPGTAKSALGRRLAKICGGLFFQRLLTRFTTPEELFGPLSLQALENDEYRRRTDGFLPQATVAFLDEIFKANSAILNTLLTILNERTFDNGAGNREECPIRCVIAASNELPESDELDALFDRFLLRKEVLPVSDEGVIQMLSLSAPGSSPCDLGTSSSANDSVCEVVFSDGLDRVVETLSQAADRVSMGMEASFLLRDLRSFTREEMDVDISDRRLVKAARLLKVSAASHGRTSVDPIDCLLLQHIAWRLPEQRTTVREWLWDHVTPGSVQGQSSISSNVAQFRFLLNGLRQEVMAAVRKTNGDVTGDSGGRDVDLAVIKSLHDEAAQIVAQLQEQTVSLMRHIELLRRSADHLWLDPDEAKAMQQLLIPKAEVFLQDTNRVLRNARSLVVALSGEQSMVASNTLRLSVIEQLWDDSDEDAGVSFKDEELSMGMKEAKAKFDSETLRKWKKARKVANKRT